MSKCTGMRVKVDISVFLVYTEVKVKEEKTQEWKTKAAHGPRARQSQKLHWQLPGLQAWTPRPAKQGPSSLEKLGASFLNK